MNIIITLYHSGQTPHPLLYYPGHYSPLHFTYEMVIPGDKSSVMKIWVEENDFKLVKPVNDWDGDPVVIEVDDEEFALLLLKYS